MRPSGPARSFNTCRTARPCCSRTSTDPPRPRGGSRLSCEEAPISALAIATTRLGKTYRRLLGPSHPAVRDLDLKVPMGSVTGLLGPNGAGKTTTILMLLGVLRPSSGGYSLFGAPMGDAAVRRRVGFVPEKFQLPARLKAREFLQFHGRLCGMSGDQLDRRAKLLLAQVGLGDRAETAISEFSKGMQQRLALAQALLHDPDLVILDEPSSALDPMGRAEVRAIIEELKARNKTVLLNSHILSDVESVCDGVAIMREGCLERQGSMATLTAGGILVRVRVGGLHPELSERIASLGNGLKVLTHDDIAEIELQVADESALPGIAEAIGAGGGRLYAMVPEKESLEDIFMNVIKGNA